MLYPCLSLKEDRTANQWFTVRMQEGLENNNSKTHSNSDSPICLKDEIGPKVIVIISPIGERESGLSYTASPCRCRKLLVQRYVRAPEAVAATCFCPSKVLSGIVKVRRRKASHRYQL